MHSQLPFPRRVRVSAAAPQRTSSELLTRRVLPVLAPLAVLVVFVLIWSVYAHTAGGSLFPTPIQTVHGFWDSARSSTIWRQTALSWRSLAIGYGISVVGGILFGLLLGVSRPVDRILGIYLDIALVTPMIVMMPIVLIALGVTSTAEVVVVIFFSLPYVTLPIRNGVRSMPQLWFDLSASLCANRRQTWRHILLPGARRAIANGLRLGLAHALSGLLVVEFTLVALGIGQVVLTYKANFELGAMIGYVFLVMAQVLLVMTAITRLDREPRGRSR